MELTGTQERVRVSTAITIRPGTDSAKLEPYVFRSDLIPLMWDEMASILQPCVDDTQGMLEMSNLRQWLLEEQATAFATVRAGKIEALLVVMTVDYASYKAIRIIACAGKKLEEAMEFIDALEAWALTQGCVEIEGWVREPMRRLTRRLGWKTKRTIIVRDLRRRLQ